MIERVRVYLNNNFCYTGKVLSEDDKFLTIEDIKGKTVTITKTNIIIREVVKDNIKNNKEVG